MAAMGRRHRRTVDIWPGFVDAIANLLIVITFLLLIFVIAQFLLGETLSERDVTLRRLQTQVADLGDLLALERRTGEALGADVRRLTEELQASLRARDEQAAAIQALAQRAEVAEQQGEEIGRRLGDATATVAALEALKAELERRGSQLGEKATAAEGALAAEREVNAEARAQIALLNQQIAAMRQQLAELASLLDVSEAKAREREVQISTLGQRLNAALASRVQELSRYRSEFFGRLREVLGDRPDVRIVGDRFVFQSEVLFASGSAELGEEGQVQIARVAETLKAVARDIPSDIDWLLQVEGHTDRVPINSLLYPSNWELSVARAMAVLRLLVDTGIPPPQLSAAGFAEFRPLDDRDDPAARQRNRRIELKLTQR